MQELYKKINQNINLHLQLIKVVIARWCSEWVVDKKVVKQIEKNFPRVPQGNNSQADV